MTRYDQNTIKELKLAHEDIKTIIETISTREIPVAFKTRLRDIILELKQAVTEMVNKG